MPDSSNNQEGFCGSKKCKTLSIIAVIILIIIIIAIAVPISLAGCKTGYTGEECDVCDTGYHMDNHGLCKGLKISFRTQIYIINPHPEFVCVSVPLVSPEPLYL